MKIIKAYPPNFAKLAKAFPYIKGRKGILYSWVDRIYNPSGVVIGPQLMIHEAVHGLQQEELGVEKWWEQYIESKEFRFYEEALAHKAEWKAYQENTPEFKDRASYLERHLRQIVDRLSGPLYGNMLGKEECREVITGKKAVEHEYRPETDTFQIATRPIDITTATIQ